MAKIFLNVLTTHDITSPETGRRIGSIIQEYAPQIFPDKIGNYEPISNPCSSPDDFVRYWNWPVLAKHRKPRVDFSFWFRKPHRRYSAIAMDFSADAELACDVPRLLARIARLVEAEFGMVQSVSDNYQIRADQKKLLSYTRKIKRDLFFLHIYDESIENGIPDAFDIMWLPESKWIVNSPNLSRNPDGVYILSGNDSKVRDEVIQRVQKRTAC